MPASAFVLLGKAGARLLCVAAALCMRAAAVHCVLAAGQEKTDRTRMLDAAGGVLVIVICFMAVTSSGASEMVAVSSLFTFDVYRRYIHPKVRPAAASCCYWPL